MDDEQIFDGSHCPECGSENIYYLEQRLDIYGEYTEFELNEDDIFIRMGCSGCGGTFWHSDETGVVVAFTDGIE